MVQYGRQCLPLVKPGRQRNIPTQSSMRDDAERLAASTGQSKVRTNQAKRVLGRPGTDICSFYVLLSAVACADGAAEPVGRGLKICARRPISRVLSPDPSPDPMDDHSSGTFVAKRLARRTRMAARKTRLMVRRSRAGNPAIEPSLLGLAPGGVYPAVRVAASAVRSYRTLSPLPRHGRPKPVRVAVCFLWHFP